MNKYVITYDLIDADGDYQGLYDRLSNFPEAVKLTESVWMIKTKLTADDVVETLKNSVHCGIRLTVSNAPGLRTFNDLSSQLEFNNFFAS